MRRALAAAFLTGFAALLVGLALVLGAVLAAGDWWLARQPWIGLGLDALVVGLAAIHLTAPPLILVGLAPKPWRGMMAYALLIAFAVVGFWLSSTPGVAPMVFAGLLFGWVAVAVTLIAWRERLARVAAAITIAPVVAVSFVVTGIWWLIVATGGYAGIGPPRTLRDAGTLIYSAPDIAMTLLGLPTVALIALSLVVLFGRLTSRRWRTRQATADAAVLT